MSTVKQIKFNRAILELQKEYNNGNKKPLEDLLKANTLKLFKLSVYNFLSIKPISFF
ncbi:MAG: hypothetical protein QG594_1462 [Bacteroidota bacterium]|jgi:hypothetical protein|nr:hypothetical protein [Bacteroidota bacterium]